MSSKREDTIYNHRKRILNIIEGSLFYNHDFEYDGDDYQDVGISYDEYEDENIIWKLSMFFWPKNMAHGH